MNLQYVGAPAGGCCTGSSCALLTLEECVNLGGTYLGDSSSCAADADGDGWCDPGDGFGFCAGMDTGSMNHDHGLGSGNDHDGGTGRASSRHRVKSRQSSWF